MNVPPVPLPHTAGRSRPAGPDITQVLFDHQLTGTPLVLVASPPGAGKSTLVVDLAARCAAAGDHVAIVTVTNSQAGHLSERLAASGQSVTLCIGRDAPDPHPADPHGRVQLSRHQPTPTGLGGSITVACGAKWTWAPDSGPLPPFDVMIVDEAWMLPWAGFHLIANLARRHVLVGDPGQISPFSPAAQERWHGNPTGPLVPAAQAARHRRPDAPLLVLPHSWRLPHDTVNVIQPALYPDLSFTAGHPPGHRTVTLQRPDATAHVVPSLRATVLPPAPTGDLLPVGCHEAATAAAAALQQVRLHHMSGSRRLTPERLAVAVSRHQQATAVRQALPNGLADRVVVATINALQGLEFDYVIALDPLIGATRLSPFLLEQGRLCVALTRHLFACELLTDTTVTARLHAHRPTSARYLGSDPDPEFQGVQAHLRLRRALGL